jgi:hypothetical protein
MVESIQAAQAKNPSLDVDAEIAKMLEAYPEERRQSFHDMIKSKMGIGSFRRPY